MERGYKVTDLKKSAEQIISIEKTSIIQNPLKTKVAYH